MDFSLREWLNLAVRWLHVLAQDDHADIGLGRSQFLREPDTLVGLRWRHPNVGEDDVGLRFGHRRA